MSGMPATSAPPCGPASGNVVALPGVGGEDPLIQRTRATWTAGDFGRIAVGFAEGAAAFVERLGLKPGETVLDVASGTGNLTLPAARHGATVTGIDIAPNLVDAARAAGSAAGLAIRFDVGAAEALPYQDAAFDTVISMFGVMFTAHPAQALAEMLRVTRPGGRIVMANWAPLGFIGAMLRAHVAHVPPPPGVPSTLAWGDEQAMRERLQPHASRVANVRFIPRTIGLGYPLTPGGVVELFREFYGPSIRTFGALDAAGRASLGSDLLGLWTGRNEAPAGSTLVHAEYTEVTIDVA